MKKPLRLPKLKPLMTERERAEKLVYVISQMMDAKPSAKNISRATDWLEGRLDMGAPIDDKLLFRVEDKLTGNWEERPAKKNPVKPRKGETERKFVSRCMSEEKQSFPKLKQRIAVCLSKARKNPLLESGATISKNSGINRRAASMT